MDTGRSGFVLDFSWVSGGGIRTYSGYPDFLRSDYPLLDIVKDCQSVMLSSEYDRRGRDTLTCKSRYAIDWISIVKSRNDLSTWQHGLTSILLFRHQNKSTEDRVVIPHHAEQPSSCKDRASSLITCIQLTSSRHHTTGGPAGISDHFHSVSSFNGFKAVMAESARSTLRD